ncbi:MAG TPA: serine protease [Casimicrobiaceae bacterium]|nr:serine protease [Casimicrobiaceae bacterium]
MLLAIVTACATAQAPEATPASPPPAAISSVAEAIYTGARPRLIQVRTLVAAAGRQASIGSGFLVSADGLALTNYHVVSQFALEPGTYRLEYLAPDGTRGDVALLAIDVVNDLAAVRIQRAGDAFFELDGRAVDGRLPQGERLFALGNPLDLGFGIVEGTYNGFVERSFSQRLHFSGALNAGMSGGPTVTSEGRVAGVNVAKRLDGELVSFLVPAQAAAALIERARSAPPLTTDDVRAEIARQLDTFQASLAKGFADAGFKPARYGGYTASESQAPWVQCWARTNADAKPAPRARVHTTSCATRTSLFLAGDLRTGTASLEYTYIESVSLNPFQFANFVAQKLRSGAQNVSRRRLTSQRCHEDFLRSAESPLVRATFCARAYRDFPDLYDVAVVAVTQDDDKKALVGRLSLSGIAWDNATTFARRFASGIGRTQ